MLLYESMLDTILYARDKWFNKETGLIFPDKYTMFLAGFTDKFNLKMNKLVYWRDVYGVDMSCLGQNFYVEPMVDHIDNSCIVTSSCKFYELDLYTATKEDAIFANKYKIKMFEDSKVDGMVIWFETHFSKNL